MSPQEKSIAIRKDEDYTDEEGSLKKFSKEVWRASCKWQRRRRARQEQTILNLGQSVDVPLISQHTEDPNNIDVPTGLSTILEPESFISSGQVDDEDEDEDDKDQDEGCLLYTSPSPRDATLSRMPSSA